MRGASLAALGLIAAGLPVAAVDPTLAPTLGRALLCAWPLVLVEACRETLPRRIVR